MAWGDWFFWFFPDFARYWAAVKSQLLAWLGEVPAGWEELERCEAGCAESGAFSSILELEDGDGTSLTSSCGMVFEALVRSMLLFHSRNCWKRAELSSSADILQYLTLANSKQVRLASTHKRPLNGLRYRDDLFIWLYWILIQALQLTCSCFTPASNH